MNPSEWKFILGPLLAPIYWLIVLSVALWITRRFFPRAEWWLFSPISTVLKRLLHRRQVDRHPS